MYFNSVEFRDFPPFAKGSRMECHPVSDKPDDLAEVHLITGENGTGKSRLLSLLAAALGQPGPLKTRCPKEVLNIATKMRLGINSTKEPTLVLRVSNEGISTEGTQSEILLEMTQLLPALSRTGIAFINEKEEPKKGSFRKSVVNNRLLPVPAPSYSSGFLPRLQQVIVAARLRESPEMIRLAEKVENVLSEILGEPFKFFPRTYPLEEMWVECAIFRKEGPIPISGCPDGLLSLLGWVVDSALVMEEFSNNWDNQTKIILGWEEQLMQFVTPVQEESTNDFKEAHDSDPSAIWSLVSKEFGAKFPLQAGYIAESWFSRIEGKSFVIQFPDNRKLAAQSIERPSIRAGVEDLLSRSMGQRVLLKIETVPHESIPEQWRSRLKSNIRKVAENSRANKVPNSAFSIPCIILLDEIETHLHPSWQWKVLPAFQKMFPKAQIFVATHSPFVIASLNKGMIHRLRRGPDGVVDDPRPASEGDSYESALEDIQDVKQRFDPTSEALLDGFYKQRGAALAGDGTAITKARALVKDIASRSSELEEIIGRESRQMERQLKELASK